MGRRPVCAQAHATCTVDRVRLHRMLEGCNAEMPHNQLEKHVGPADHGPPGLCEFYTLQVLLVVKTRNQTKKRADNKR